MELRKELVPEESRKAKPADENQLGFGKLFTDHMFCLDYMVGKGWHQPRIVPYGDLIMSPASMVLHYGQGIFEGLKAYRGNDGHIYMFRPMDNVRRFNVSADRVCIPLMPENELLEWMMELVRLERDWVPRAPGTSLYVRPTVIATSPFLGVKPSNRYLCYIITGPVGAYYPEGFNPVSIMVEEKYVRAAPGGTGEAKTMGNYAASLKAQVEAQQKGFTQVLWLDACERRCIEEVGTMNIFFKIGGQVITSALDGTILSGITRDSVIKLLHSWGVEVSQRRITIDEVMAAQAQGSLEEVFGTGTAAVISPVASIHYRGQDHAVADGGTGPLAQKLYDELTGIQWGDRPDPFGWRVKVV